MIFSDLSFAEASRRASTAERWLLVDVTATWCEPCQLMERTTWRDPRVAAWVAEHAVAVQVDVDRQKDLARELLISSMPTVLLFRDGREMDRLRGARPAAGLIKWLEEVRLGRKRGVPPQDIQARLVSAHDHLESHRCPEALVEYEWLWLHMVEHDRSMRGVRLSYLAHDLGRLVAEHPPSRARFTELRNQTHDRTDWIVLNEVLGEVERTLAWFDVVVTGDAHADFLERIAFRLIPALRERGRFADIGRIFRDPLAHLRRNHKLLWPVEGRAERRPGSFAEARSRFRDGAGVLVRSLRAAGRLADADAVHDEALRLDDSQEMRAALAA